MVDHGVRASTSTPQTEHEPSPAAEARTVGHLVCGESFGDRSMSRLAETAPAQGDVRAAALSRTRRGESNTDSDTDSEHPQRDRRRREFILQFYVIFGMGAHVWILDIHHDFILLCEKYTSLTCTTREDVRRKCQTDGRPRSDRIHA